MSYQGVNKVAIYGYSRGGGATYWLAQGLSDGVVANPPLITSSYSLVFTSYLDGIQESLWQTGNPEIRRPSGSLFHTNQYQRNDVLRGEYMPSADDNFDRSSLTSAPGIKVDHVTMPNHLEVIDFLKTRIRQKVPK